MQCIRAFFHAEGFVEVETPVRLKIPCMELHIDAEPSGDHYLRTSPELFHKKLIAQGADKIFEIGKCFRQGERGNLHNPEYTMLEWYRTGGDYMTALADTQKLLESISAGSLGSRTSATDCRTGAKTPPIPFVGGVPEGLGGFPNAWKQLRCVSALRVAENSPLSKPWKIFTISEVFEEFAGWNPVEDLDADRFDFDLVEKVEPALPKDCPVVLKDYPAELCALARFKPGNPKVAERWELYLGGVEIANAYSELTDPVEQRRRFEHWGEQRRALGKTVYPIDLEFIDCLERMPPTCGVALGVDRLLMSLFGEDSLDAVLPFRD